MLATLSSLLGPNLLLLVGIVVLIFGGKKLPELARGLRSSIKEFNRGKEDPDHSGPEPKGTKETTETPRR